MHSLNETNGDHKIPVHATPTEPNGSLIIIGGREQKQGALEILEEVARRVGAGKLIVATIASEEPEEQWEDYRKVFNELGVTRIEHLNVKRREELLDNPRIELFDDVQVLFFAGGDQLKITSKFGGTPLCDRMRQLYQSGATIAGTSSGASVMSEVMMAGGEDNSSSSSPQLAAGLALVPGLIIDQHFAERGRIARLFQAIAQNPRLLGIGIDEDTAVILQGHREFTVLGNGAVYVIDGARLRYTNLTEENTSAPSIYGMVVHVLSAGDRFDLGSREPTYVAAEAAVAHSQQP
jgi:cyanophycinase